MRNPAKVPVFVDYRSTNDSHQWRRIMIATKSWVLEQLADLGDTPDGSTHILLSTVLVIPDGSPKELQLAVDKAIAAPGTDHFSTLPSDEAG